jgi:ubiquinone/menaquinone biosynthesis C-methylase UbiE
MTTLEYQPLQDLIDHVDKIDQITDEQWKSTLNDRKIKELEFHDRDRDRSKIEETQANDTFEKFYGNRKYYRATKRSTDYVQQWIAREAKGKVFLDYACGNGKNAIHAAQSGAALSLGFDISGISVHNAREAAEEAGVTSNSKFFQADCENTNLPDNSIDVIICSGMLHHLDLSYAMPELRRIMKPGAKLLAVEALDYNPAIKLYRMMTPAMRTDWEKAHILDLSDVRFASRFFTVEEVKFWHIFGYIAGKFPALFPLLDGMDRLLEKVPYLQRMGWIFTFVLRKNQE